MHPNHLFHAEFGYLCPTTRLRRELRLAGWGVLFGMAVGAASVIALNRAARPDADAVSTQAQIGQRAPPGLANTKTVQEAPQKAVQDNPPEPSQPISAGKTNLTSHTNPTDNAPEIARVPLGRPVPLERARPLSGNDDEAGPGPQSSPAYPAVSAPALRDAAKSARLPSVIEPRTRRIARHPHKQPIEDGLPERAFARHTIFPRTVFWDWAQ